jgi:nucleoside-diphosphate-sugar epimerase
LISGCNGFLGSYLFNYFSNNNQYKVIGLLRTNSNTSRIRKNIKQNITYNIDNIELSSIFKNNKIDIVVNTACNFGREENSYNILLESNVIFGKNLVNACNASTVKLFINTDTLLSEKVNAYSKTKAELRNYLKLFNSELKIINLRIEYIFGPGDDKNKFIPWFIDQLRNTNTSVKLHSGEQLRDFIYIDDVVDAYHHIIINNKQFKFSYTELDLTTNCLTPMKDIITLLSEKLSKIDKKSYLSRLSFGEKKYRKNDFMTPQLNNKSLISKGWNPNYDLEAGLNKLIKNI